MRRYKILLITFLTGGIFMSEYSENARKHFEEAIEYIQKGDYLNAEKELKEAIKINVNYPEAHFELGRVLYTLGKYEEAEKEYKEAIKIDPNFIPPYINLGWLLHELNRNEEAENLLRKAIERKPSNIEIYCHLGNILSNLGRYEEAEEEYRKVKKELLKAKELFEKEGNRDMINYCNELLKSMSPFGSMIITSEGIDEIKIGKKFNPKFVQEDFSKHYFCRYIGDVQPVEGLSFFEGQILIFFESGPFQKSASKEFIEPDVEKFAPLFLKAIKKGLTVSEIVVFGPIAKTDKGITVGSTFKMLKESYPDIVWSTVPDAFTSDGLICVANSKSLPNVCFIFSDECKKLEEDSKIIRIHIYKEED